MINAVTEDFAKEHPNYIEENLHNNFCFNCELCENCEKCIDCKKCIDCVLCRKCNECNKCFESEYCVQVSFSKWAVNCHQSYKLINCRNCDDCRLLEDNVAVQYKQRYEDKLTIGKNVMVGLIEEVLKNNKQNQYYCPNIEQIQSIIDCVQESLFERNNFMNKLKPANILKFQSGLEIIVLRVVDIVDGIFIGIEKNTPNTKEQMYHLKDFDWQTTIIV